MHNNKLAYRRDIDGLRAIAVLSVVGYHAFPQWFPGGFVGVDIFFVISGFLITSILVKSATGNYFSIADFYNRRIRRIFPALITVFITCLVFGWLILFPDELQQLGKHTLGAVFFVANFMFWSEAGYFDNASELKPLLHLWSLSIEEQFYALWPITLFLFVKSGRAFLCTAILAMVSLSICLFGGLDKIANFYMPLTRIWELLCGGMLVFLSANQNPSLHKISNNSKTYYVVTEILAFTGVVLLGLAIFFVLDNKTTFPGWFALLPVSGAMLVIATGPDTFTHRHILGNPVFVFLGLISYPLYLWHWPLLSFPKIAEGLVLSTNTKIMALAAATVLATMTYYTIERPLRHRGSTISMLLILAAVIMAALGYFFSVGMLSPKNSGKLFQQVATATKDVPLDPALSRAYNVTIDNRAYMGTGSGSKTSLFIGDSNMDQYWLGVEATLAAKTGDRKALLGGCHIPIPHVIAASDDIDCNNLNEHAYSIAANHPDIDTVVIAALWTAASSYLYVDGKQTYAMNTATGMEKAMQQLESHIHTLTSKGKTVYLIQNIPAGPEFEPHNLIQRSLRGFKMAPHLEGGITLATHKKQTEAITGLLAGVAKRSNAIILDPADFLCKTGWCSAVTPDGQPIYRDRDHLRGSYSYHHPEFISQTLK